MKNNDKEPLTEVTFATPDYIAEGFEIVRQVEKAYDEDRYVDIDGLVWLGTADERWVMAEDAHYWLTPAQMTKKMLNELSGAEQYSRDEAVRIEALYEYAIQRTRVNPVETSTIAGDVWGPRDEVNMSLLDLNSDHVHYRLVRRRKAGPVEVVDA